MKKIKKTIILVIFILVSIFIYMLVGINKDFSTKVTNNDVKSIDINFGEQVYTYNSYIYIYGKSGIKILKNDNILKEDSVLLEDKFNFENPQVVTSFDKIAICDVNNKVARVYSNNGHMYTVNAVSNILGFSVNKNGVLSIILKNENSYQIEVYDNGEKLYSVNDISYDEGVPVSVSVSNDDKVLAVSYIKAKGATINSSIVFYSIQDNRVFGGIVKDNQIVGIIKFSGKDSLISISDKEIFITNINSIQSNEQVKEIYRKPLNNTIKYINFLDNIGYLICYGKPTLNTDDTIPENTVVFYNNSGGEIGKYYNKNQDIDDIYTNKYGAILKDSKTFTAINTLGRKLWTYQTAQDIKSMNFYDDINKAIITTNDKVKIVKINKKLLNDVGNNIDDEATTEENTTEKNDAEQKNTEKETQKNKESVEESSIKEKETQKSNKKNDKESVQESSVKEKETQETSAQKDSSKDKKDKITDEITKENTENKVKN